MSDEIRLSEEQRAIVSHPLAPLRIAAGAGTGKTTTVVLRLREAIAQGMAPEEALGITFTNKAAGELADRIRRELPDLAATGREVEVTTYHGFAYRLLNEFGALLGIERDSEIIGGGYQRQLLLESLRELTFDHLDLTHPPSRVAEAATLARQLGDNLRNGGDLLAVPPSGDDVELRRQELARVVAAYETEKSRLGVLDYADLIRMAHRLVTEHPRIAERVRSRYRVVLLDEYQDTDPGQRLLLGAIFGNGFPVTAVGDSDQTIYEWRGATRQNFEHFPDHFPTAAGSPAPTLPLTLNRRSDTLILDLANRVRSEVHSNAALSPLRPISEAPTGEIHTAWLRTTAEETAWVAEQTRRLHDEEGVAWGDMAILFRKNRNIPAVRDALEAADVPLEVVSLGGLLFVPEVIELHAWLRIIHDGDDSEALARVLLGGKYRLGLGDLAPLSRWVHARHRGRSPDDGVPGWQLLEAIDGFEDIAGLTPEAQRRIGEFRELYRDLLVQAQGTSLVELCRRLLDAIGAWAEIDAMSPHASLSARLNVYRFLDLAESWSPLEGRPSLEAFLGYLQLLLDDNASDELDTATVGSEDAVSLLTVHRAKGLEWNVVFLPALTRGTFPASSRGFDNPIDSPQYVPHHLRIDRETLPDLASAPNKRSRDDLLRADHLAQEWRAAYVAVTRARHRLYLSGSFWGLGKQPQQRSDLFDMATSLAGAVTDRVVGDPGERPEYSVPNPDAALPDPVFPAGWQAALRAAVTDPDSIEAAFPDIPYDERTGQLRLAVANLPMPPPPPDEPALTTSVTGLVTLATCPQRFRWTEIDPLPRRPSAALRRGVEFHRKVELHNLGIVPLDDMHADLYDVPEFGGEDPRPGGDPYETYLASRFATQAPRFVEVPIDIKVAERRIRGRIDAVYEPTSDTWEVVDYKSGIRRDDPARRVQLEAYALAAAGGAIAADIPANLQVTFAYFGGPEVEEVSEAVDQSWLDAAEVRISELLDRATEGDLPATPSAACRHCDFLSFCQPGTAHLKEADAGGTPLI